MGVAWDDCFHVGELLGVKTILNEFVAYNKLSKLIENRRQKLGGKVLAVSFDFWCQYFVARYH